MIWFIIGKKKSDSVWKVSVNDLTIRKRLGKGRLRFAKNALMISKTWVRVGKISCGILLCLSSVTFCVKINVASYQQTDRVVVVWWSGTVWILLSTRKSWRIMSGHQFMPWSASTFELWSRTMTKSGPKFLPSNAKDSLAVIANAWLQFLQPRVAQPVIRFSGQLPCHTRQGRFR